MDRALFEHDASHKLLVSTRDVFLENSSLFCKFCALSAASMVTRVAHYGPTSEKGDTISGWNLLCACNWLFIVTPLSSQERLHNPGSKMAASATVIRDSVISVTPAKGGV